MAWKPAVSDGEVVLVSCNTQARRRVPFHVVLTDKKLRWARPTVWALDGLVTECVDLESLSDARLDWVSPWGLYLFGLFALSGLVAAIWGTVSGSLHGGWFGGVAMLAAVAISFGGARQRVKLRFVAGGRRCKIVTPVGSHAGVRAEMGDALREIARLLADRNQLSLQARELRVEREREQDREPEDD